MKKSIKKGVIITLFLIFINNIQAQQDPNFSLYNFNMSLLNPAYAGSIEGKGITMAYKNQWLGFPGAPKSISATYSWSTKKKIGLALNVYSNKFFITDRVNISTDISYNVQLAEETKLYFGLKFGGAFFNIDFRKIQTTVSDPNFSESNNSFNAHLGFGVYIVNSNYYITASTPNFIKEKIGEKNISENTNFYIGGGYHLDLNENLTLTPRVMIGLLGSYDNTFDIGASLDIFKKITLGSNYRINETIAFYGLVKVIEDMVFGLSYDFTTSKLNTVSNNGSLDIILKYRL